MLVLQTRGGEEKELKKNDWTGYDKDLVEALERDIISQNPNVRWWVWKLLEVLGKAWSPSSSSPSLFSSLLSLSAPPHSPPLSTFSPLSFLCPSLCSLLMFSSLYSLPSLSYFFLPSLPFLSSFTPPLSTPSHFSSLFAPSPRFLLSILFSFLSTLSTPFPLSPPRAPPFPPPL